MGCLRSPIYNKEDKLVFTLCTVGPQAAQVPPLFCDFFIKENDDTCLLLIKIRNMFILIRLGLKTFFLSLSHHGYTVLVFKVGVVQKDPSSTY